MCRNVAVGRPRGWFTGLVSSDHLRVSARFQGGLSPDRQGRDVSPGRQRRRRNYRRQSTTMGSYNVRSCQSSRSPESSSSCSSREPSPAGRAVTPAASHRTPIIRRQSTTEEILIARGFRRQVRVAIVTVGNFRTVLFSALRKRSRVVFLFWRLFPPSIDIFTIAEIFASPCPPPCRVICPYPRFTNTFS